MIHKMYFGLLLMSLHTFQFSSIQCEILTKESEFPISPETQHLIKSDVDEKMRLINQIITPSDICKEIVSKFASAISNFTLCSIRNSKPIHLCEWCISQYLMVVETHHDFSVTIDEKGNACKEYFTNLDRIEIVKDAYMYVLNLWRRGKCDYCFKRNETSGSIIPQITSDVSDFDTYYELTKSCFDVKRNDTCTKCKAHYEKMNRFYIWIVEEKGENVCIDVVDTMNITRAIWSQTFHCNSERKMEIWLHVCMGLFAMMPLIFYFFAYVCSSKQEARVLQQRRWAELYASASNSCETDASASAGYVSSRFSSSDNTAERSTVTKSQ